MIEFTDKQAERLEKEIIDVIDHARKGSRKAWKFLQAMGITINTSVEQMSRDKSFRESIK